jgi:hypothetical protein
MLSCERVVGDGDNEVKKMSSSSGWAVTLPQ